MPTQVEACNLALDILGEQPITDIAAASVKAQALNRNFGPALEEVLRSHPWNFAKTRVILTATTTPESQWDFAYILPDDFVTLIQLNGTDFDGDVGRFAELENNLLLTDEATAEIQYIRKPLPQAATPTFTPAAGAYVGTQSVTIASTTSGATIRYTTNGTTPTESVGTVYTGAVSIPATATLKAIAYKSKYKPSAVASGTYTIS